jgi:hypothetical protein
MRYLSGNIEAVSGPAAQGRPGAHEWIVWEGQATDKAEAVNTNCFFSSRAWLGGWPNILDHFSDKATSQVDS